MLRRVRNDFDGICERYYSKIMALIRKKLYGVNGKDIVRDVCHDVFYKVFTKINLYERREDRDMYSWIARIADNTVKDYLRRESRIKFYSLNNRIGTDEELSFIDIIKCQRPLADAVCAQNEMKDRIGSILESMDGRYGSVIKLKFIEGLSYKEIARNLKVSEVNARKICQRGRDKFREIYDCL